MALKYKTGLYRTAYYTYEKIISGAGGNYKQSVALKDEAQKKGTISILINDFSYQNYRYSRTASQITSDVKSELSTLSNPFIRIIDPSSLNVNIYENGKMKMQAANLAGIKAVLSGSVNQIRTSNGRLQKEEKRGYLKHVTKTKDKEGKEVEKVSYTKTVYYEYEQTSRASLGLDFKLISTEDNSVLVSDVINDNQSDRIHYAVFQGDKDKLVPGYWKYKNSDSKEDVIKDNKSDVRSLHNLLKADKNIKSAETLLSELMNKSVKQVTNKIDKYNPEN